MPGLIDCHVHVMLSEVNIRYLDKRTADVHLRQHHVDVAVDEAGHQRAALAVDDAGFRRLDRAKRDFADDIAFDQHGDAAFECVRARIEELRVLEQDLRHCERAPTASGANAASAGDHAMAEWGTQPSAR